MINFNRRKLLKSAGLGLAGMVLPRLSSAAGADDRILVVVELSGGNDGLNTIVPFGDDAYYRHRPDIGIRSGDLLDLDDHYGFNPGALGLQRLWQRGDLAVVHGCGYPQPSFSHFTSMAYWHTGAPHSGNQFGWMGRLADAILPERTPNALINIGASQSLAVKSQNHTPVVFDDPMRFQRKASAHTRQTMDQMSPQPSSNRSRDFLNDVALSARESSALVRQAWSDYSTDIDYGIQPMDLPKVAACISADLPTSLYYVAFRNNAFDTHVAQPALHRRLLSYACDGIHGFLTDMDRVGQADRIAVVVFSEFGRRVPENANLGTDHGSANVMFVAGKSVTGGHYGERPSLEKLDAGDNLIYTTDFRRVYATAIDGWLRTGKASEVLGGSYPPLDIFLTDQ